MLISTRLKKGTFERFWSTGVDSVSPHLFGHFNNKIKVITMKKTPKSASVGGASEGLCILLSSNVLCLLDYQCQETCCGNETSRKADALD